MTACSALSPLCDGERRPATGTSPLLAGLTHGGLPNDETGGDHVGARPRLLLPGLAGDAPQQDPNGECADGQLLLDDGREWRLGERGDLGVAVADDRDIVR